MKTKKLGQKLKELRATRGMSQEYLAEESRVSLRTIQRIESNESEPTGETIKRIANALDVPITELTNSGAVTETSDLKATIIYLKKQLSKTNEKPEIKVFEKFIVLLEKLKDKDLSIEQTESIESYLRYLELEKIPSFNNEIYKQKLAKLKRHLRSKLGFVPNNHYTTWTASFSLSFAIAFAIQSNIDAYLKLGVASVALFIVGVGIFIDMRMRRQERTFSF